MVGRVAICITMIAMLFSAGVSPALSQEKSKEWTVVDLKTLDCRTFLKMTGDERGNTVSFYHGLLTGMKKETTINIPALAEITDKVLDQCVDKPNAILLKVFEENRK